MSQEGNVWWVDYRNGSFADRLCEADDCTLWCDPGFSIRVFGENTGGQDADAEESHYFCRDHRDQANECRTQMRLKYPSINT